MDDRQRPVAEPSAQKVNLSAGFAAGCEARLCLAAKLTESLGWAPGPAFGPKTWGQSPNRGRSPVQTPELSGGAKPRLTSGGEAGGNRSSFMSGS